MKKWMLTPCFNPVETYAIAIGMNQLLAGNLFMAFLALFIGNVIIRVVKLIP